MIEPTHDFIRNETSRYEREGGKIAKLKDQVVKRGLTAIPKPLDRTDEETDTDGWLSGFVSND